MKNISECWVTVVIPNNLNDPFKFFAVNERGETSKHISSFKDFFMGIDRRNGNRNQIFSYQNSKRFFSLIDNDVDEAIQWTHKKIINKDTEALIEWFKIQNEENEWTANLIYFLRAVISNFCSENIIFTQLIIPDDILGMFFSWCEENKLNGNFPPQTITNAFTDEIFLYDFDDQKPIKKVQELVPFSFDEKENSYAFIPMTLALFSDVLLDIDGNIDEEFTKKNSFKSICSDDNIGKEICCLSMKIDDEKNSLSAMPFQFKLDTNISINCTSAKSYSYLSHLDINTIIDDLILTANEQFGEIQEFNLPLPTVFFDASGSPSSVNDFNLKGETTKALEILNEYNRIDLHRGLLKRIRFYLQNNDDTQISPFFAKKIISGCENYKPLNSRGKKKPKEINSAPGNPTPKSIEVIETEKIETDFDQLDKDNPNQFNFIGSVKRPIKKGNEK